MIAYPSIYYIFSISRCLQRYHVAFLCNYYLSQKTHSGIGVEYTDTDLFYSQTTFSCVSTTEGQLKSEFGVQRWLCCWPFFQIKLYICSFVGSRIFKAPFLHKCMSLNTHILPWIICMIHLMLQPGYSHDCGFSSSTIPRF